MSPHPKTSALALAATLSSLAPSRAEGQAPPDPPPPEAFEGLGPAKTQPTSELRPTQPPASRAEEVVEEAPPKERNRTIEPFAAFGFNTSFITTDLGSYTFPRVAPVLGAGLRIKPDAKFSAQFELTLDFLGGTYSYLYYLISWYTYAATYLSLPLLARHRLSSGKRVTHFTWGLKLSQKIGESRNSNILGVPFYVEASIPRGYYYGYYGGYYGGSGDGFFTQRMLSLTVGYQSRKVSRGKIGSEFEMRFSAGVARLSGEREAHMVSGFSFRWNLVPGTGEK